MRNLGITILLTLTLVAGAFAQSAEQSTTANVSFKNNDHEDRGGDREREETEKDDHDDRAPVQSGYAVVSSASTAGLVVFETFGLKHGNETLQAGLLPSDLTTDAVLFVNASGKLSRNLGVAIVNPASADVNVTLTLAKDDGSVIANKTIVVKPGQQTARFVTELFSDRPSVPKDLTGTVRLTSTGPVSVIGLRFRGVNFSTIPLTSLSAPATVPASSAVATGSSIILPHFAAGGGWATEIVIMNSGKTAASVRVDLFKADGSPLTTSLNGQAKSSFTGLTIPAGGVITLSPRDREGSSRF